MSVEGDIVRMNMQLEMAQAEIRLQECLARMQELQDALTEEQDDEEEEEKVCVCVTHTYTHAHPHPSILSYPPFFPSHTHPPTPQDDVPVSLSAFNPHNIRHVASLHTQINTLFSDVCFVYFICFVCFIWFVLFVFVCFVCFVRFVLFCLFCLFCFV
jgi:hypothetical protein